MTMGCHGPRYYTAADDVLTYSKCIAAGILLNYKPHQHTTVLLYDAAVSGNKCDSSSPGYKLFANLSFDTTETPRYIPIGRRCHHGISLITTGTIDIAVLWNRNQLS